MTRAAISEAIRQGELFDAQPRPVFWLGERVGEARHWGEVFDVLRKHGLPDAEIFEVCPFSRETPQAFHVGKPKLAVVR